MTLKPCPWPIDRLLPHEGRIILLDEALGYSDGKALAGVQIRDDHPLAAPGGVPAHVGIELMAQTCGVFAGAKALASALPVRIGFLLGTRNYTAHDDWFRFGDRLIVEVTSIFQEEEMAVFDCQIRRDDQIVAEAQLNLFQPKDVDSVLADPGGR